MRISNEYKLTFVSTPKCGSHSGWDLMDKYFPINYSKMHNNIVPEHCRNYNSFTFVRNPYDRAVALWNSCLWAHITKEQHAKTIGLRYRREYLKKVGSDKFEDFCKYLAYSKGNNDFYRLLEMSQTKYHSRTNIIKLNYFKIETINNTLPKYIREITGKEIVIPHKLKRKHKTWEELKTPKIKDYILKWAEKDFEAYNYDI